MPISDIVAVAATLIAAACDLARGKVYNRLTYPLAVAGVAASPFLGRITLLESLGGLAGAFALYYLMHLLGGLGAGDVKLMAAVGAWMGFSFVLYASFYILCVGSVLGILVLAYRGTLFEAVRSAGSIFFGALGGRRGAPSGGVALRTPMPFAPAIFLGVSYGIYLELTRGPFTLTWWT
jgi:prepilin peptidase CpaA